MADEKEDDIIIDELPDEVIDSGEINSTEDDAKEKKEVKQLKKPVKRRGNDEQKRINELWLGKKEAIALAEQESLARQAERAEKMQWQGMAANFAEETIVAKRELLTNKLAVATTQEEVAKLTAALSKVEAEGAQIERYKIENQVNAKPQPQKQQAQEQQSLQEMPPAIQSWLNANQEWYDPSSEGYDQEKASDVKHFAQAVEREMVTSGRATEIGTKAYIKRINDYVAQNWSDDMDENEEEAAPVEKKKSYAAPVGNRSVQNPSPGARKEYKITQAEKEMALSLDSKGRDGKSLSDTDKIKRFVTLRERTPSSGPITIPSLKGAS